MGSILLTTDLSTESRRAFEPTARLARALGKPIVLLHVVRELAALPYGAPLAPPVAPPDLDADLRAARVELEALAAGIEADVRVEVLSGADVPQTIADHAEREGADFIALATHGRTGVRRLLMGSVAEGVVRHARTPVLCFPEK